MFYLTEGRKQRTLENNPQSQAGKGAIASGCASGGAGKRQKHNQSAQRGKDDNQLSMATNNLNTRQFSAITEESNADTQDDRPPWERKREEMEIISSFIGIESHFTVVEEPSETATGQFHVLIEPNCGMDIAGCSMEIQVTYRDLDSQQNIDYEILNDADTGLTPIGLTSDQINVLKLEL